VRILYFKCKYLNISYLKRQKLKAVENTDIDLSGFPQNLTFLCTTCNQPFEVLYSIGLMMVVATETSSH
jgi:hypothetical protein